MVIRVLWDDGAENAIRYELQGHWDWDEIDEANELAYQLLSQANHEVSIIIHLSKDPNFPMEVALSYGRNIALAARNYPNFSGHIVVVGANTLNITFDQMTRYTHTRATRYVDTYFCETLYDARNVLENAGFETVFSA